MLQKLQLFSVHSAYHIQLFPTFDNTDIYISCVSYKPPSLQILVVLESNLNNEKNLLQTSFSLLPFTRQPVKVNAREHKNIHETQTDLIKTKGKRAAGIKTPDT